MKRSIVCAVIAAFGAGNAGAEPLDPSALGNLPRSDVVILGEVHDNPAHHAHQAIAVAALSPAAIVFEMIGPKQAALATQAMRDDPSALASVLGWAESGWPDFAMYHPIMTAAPGAAIKGGAVPGHAARDVARGTVTPAAAFGADARRYGLDLPLDPDDQTAREAEQMSAHCDALPPGLLPGMVAAQRLRDAALARAVIEAVDETGGPVVVITGTGHARKDQGVPAALAVAAPNLSVLSIGQLESDPGPDAPFDFWIVTEPHPRPDPCAAFR